MSMWWSAFFLLPGLFLIWKFFGGDAPRLESTWSAHGQTILVTGANGGIGKAITLDLAKRGAKVLMACRSRDRAVTAMQEIRTVTGNSALEFVKLDLSDLSSVEALVADLKKREVRLDAVVANAGVMYLAQALTGDSPTQTQDGSPLQFRANYLAHWLLVNSLLPLLSERARIVHVSSSTYALAELDFNDLEGGRAPLFLAYAQSKLAQIYHARELQKMLQRAGSSITINAVHPGYIASDIVNYLPQPIPWLFKMLWTNLFGWTCDEGAVGPLYAVLAPTLEGVGGEYFSLTVRTPGRPHSRDASISRKLWEESERLTGTQFSESAIKKAVAV